MICFKCVKRKDDDDVANKFICGSRREILKIELVNEVLGRDRIYLSEQNRNKKGRKSKISADTKHDAKQRYPQESLAKIAKDLGFSKTTMSNIVHDKRI